MKRFFKRSVLTLAVAGLALAGSQAWAQYQYTSVDGDFNYFDGFDTYTTGPLATQTVTPTNIYANSFDGNSLIGVNPGLASALTGSRFVGANGSLGGQNVNVNLPQVTYPLSSPPVEQPFRIDLSNANGGKLKLSFGLAITADWDGDVPGSVGTVPSGSGTAFTQLANADANNPDAVIIRANGREIFRETFHSTDASLQSATDNPDVVFLGGDINNPSDFNANRGFNPYSTNAPPGSPARTGDQVYNVDVEFGYDGGDLTLEFLPGEGNIGLIVSGSPGQSTLNAVEIFALDSLSLTQVVTPEPGSFALMGVALCGAAGYFGYRRRRQNA